MAIYRENFRRVELASGIVRDGGPVVIGEGDVLADRFGIDVYRGAGNFPIDLTGVSCQGYFIRQNGDTVVITGTVNGNRAYVDLPQACYAYEGQFSLAIKLVGGGTTGTMRIVDGVVRRTTTDTPVDPGSVVPSLAELLALIDDCEEATEAAQDAADSYAYLANDVSSMTPTDGADITNYGIHRWVADGEIRLSGQLSDSNYRRLMMWNGYNATYLTTREQFRRILPAGTYKFSITYLGNVVKTSIKATYTTFANEFTINNGDVVTLASDAMIALLIAPGENYGTDESYTAVRVSAIRATAKDDIAREQSCPFGTHYFKKPGEVSPDGYEHQAFPDLVYVDGTAYIISREAHSHYVQTSDPDEYGGMSIDKVTPDGRMSHVRFIQSTEEPYASAGVQYQMGTGCAQVTPDGNAVIMTGWTSDIGSNHSNYIAQMSKSLQTTVAVIGNPFKYSFSGTERELEPDGKPVFTPDGHILVTAYRGGNLFVCRSDQAYGSVPFSSLTFSVTRISAASETMKLTEASLGYCNDGNGGRELYLLARNDATRKNSLGVDVDISASVLMKCANAEGTGAWSVVKNYAPATYDWQTDQYPFDNILHEPRLLAYCKEAGLLWFCASNYRSSSSRNAVLGFIDLEDPNYTMYHGIIAAGRELNYGGYCGFQRYSGEEFDVAYYREGPVTAGATEQEALQSALMWKRVSGRMLVPKVNTKI